MCLKMDDVPPISAHHQQEETQLRLIRNGACVGYMKPQGVWVVPLPTQPQVSIQVQCIIAPPLSLLCVSADIPLLQSSPLFLLSHTATDFSQYIRCILFWIFVYKRFLFCNMILYCTLFMSFVKNETINVQHKSTSVNILVVQHDDRV